MHYPLTVPQEHVIVRAELGRVRTRCAVLPVPDLLDAVDLKGCIAWLVGQHDALRLRVDEAGKNFVIPEGRPFSIFTVDVPTGAGSSDTLSKLTRWIHSRSNPHDPSPFKVFLVRNARGLDHVVLAAQEICADRIAMQVIRSELISRWHDEPATPPPTKSYGQFALEGSGAGSAGDWWVQQHAAIAPLRLPRTRSRNDPSEPVAVLELADDGLSRLRAACAASHTTTAAMILAAVRIALRPYIPGGSVATTVPMSERFGAHRSTVGQFTTPLYLAVPDIGDDLAEAGLAVGSLLMRAMRRAHDDPRRVVESFRSSAAYAAASSQVALVHTEEEPEPIPGRIGLEDGPRDDAIAPAKLPDGLLAFRACEGHTRLRIEVRTDGQTSRAVLNHLQDALGSLLGTLPA